MRVRDNLTFAVLLIVSMILTAYVIGGAYGRAAQRELPEDAVAGIRIWQEQGCENCHTLYGQGGEYAPDLTHIMTLRGGDYIADFLVKPSDFHPDQRIMPRLTLTQTEIENLLALLAWVDTETVAADDWPPRFIQISGVGASAVLSGETVDPDADPTVTLGRSIFTQRCASCHSTSSNVVIVGPSMAGIPDRAAERVEGQSAQEYLRTSILHPSDYVVEGFADVMQKNFADVISSRELDALIAYLMTLEG